MEPVATITPSDGLTFDEGTRDWQGDGDGIIWFDVELSEPQPAGTAITLRSADIDTIAGEDYVDPVTSSDIPAGQTSGRIWFHTRGDDTFEADEDISLSIEVKSDYFRAVTQVFTATVHNDDPLPVLEALDLGWGESYVVWNPFPDIIKPNALRVANPSAFPASVTVDVVPGTATPGYDYAWAGPTVVQIPPGFSGVMQIPITFLDDYVDEADESFSIVLSDPVGATIGKARSNGGIGDNDAAPQLTSDAPTMIEPPPGQSEVFNFHLTTDAVSERAQSFGIIDAYNESTAEWGNYSVEAETVTIPAGQRSADVPVRVYGNSRADAPKTIVIKAYREDSDESAWFGPFTATIVDPLSGDTGTAPAASISDISVSEGTGGQPLAHFELNLYSPAPWGATFDVQTRDGTASAVTDYAGASYASVKVPAGATKVPLVVVLNGDAEDEPDETFDLVASNERGFTLARGTATATILDDDTPRSTAPGTGDPGAKSCASAMSGTSGPDRLAGTPRGDRLLGRGGDDRMTGAGGDDCVLGGPGRDRMVGGPGSDRFAGGPGNDTLSAIDGNAEIVNCGPGRDVARIDRLDKPVGCERVVRRG